MPAPALHPEPTTPRRPNRLAEFDPPPPTPPVNVRLAARTLFSIVLLGTGMAVALWLVYLIHAAVTRADGLGIFLRFGAAAAAEDLTMTLPSGGKLTLPRVVVPAAGYLFMVLLLAIGAKIAITLIKEGSWMLRWDIPSDSKSDRNTGDGARG